MKRERPWWRIGSRNIGRRPRRTVLTAGALAVAYTLIVVMMGWVDGLVSQMIENGTGLLTGQIRIQHVDYLPERRLYTTLGGRDGVPLDAMLSELTADPGVTAASPRVYAGALISSGDATSAALALGVIPEAERRVTRLLHTVTQGALPAPGAYEVLLGDEVARKLAVGVGDEVVIVASAADGSLGNDLFRVAGVFYTGLAALDRHTVVLPLDVAQELIVLDPDRVHEIALAVPEPWTAPAVAARVGSVVAAAEARAEPWTVFRPEIVDYAALASSWFWILEVIVFGMAAFGVANTMLMATFERRREFALVMAIGGRPSGVIRALVYEGIALGGIGLLGGAILTVPLMVWFHNAPPDLTRLVGGFTFGGAFVRPVLRVEYSVPVFVWTAVALFVTVVISSAYPALKAARTPPADTLQGRR